jgi:hypothetical protein
MVNAATCSAPTNSRTLDDDSGWLRHSRAIDKLWRPASTVADLGRVGATCGPAAFAALARLHIEAAISYFPDSTNVAWTNRTMMRRALTSIGFDFVHLSGEWPRVGMCLVHFTGPWTRRAYPAALLRQTHWVAVCGDYVFDVNWNGWLPRSNWEEVVIEKLLAERRPADGWMVMAAFEVSVDGPALPQVRPVSASAAFGSRRYRSGPPPL